MGEAFLAKYKLEYRIFLWIKRRGKQGQAQPYKLVITEQRRTAQPRPRGTRHPPPQNPRQRSVRPAGPAPR